MNLMINEYRYNATFRKYVNEYCNKNECTLEDTFKDDQVKRKFWIHTEV